MRWRSRWSFVAKPTRRRGPPEAWRREGDSNPRYLLSNHAFQACALNHSAISPPSASDCLSPANHLGQRAIARGLSGGSKSETGGRKPTAPFGFAANNRGEHFARIRVRGKIIRRVCCVALKTEQRVGGLPSGSAAARCDGASPTPPVRSAGWSLATGWSASGGGCRRRENCAND